MIHTFDRRMEIAVKDVLAGTRNEPVRCIKCKQLCNQIDLQYGDPCFEGEKQK